MEAAFVFVVFFLSIFGVFYLYITTRNRERMAMIEKGVDPALFSSVRLPKGIKDRGMGSGVKFTLKSGMLIIGMGIGCVISVLFNGLVHQPVYSLLVVGIIFICGGSGLVAGFYMGRNLEKKDVAE
ncbi:MAG: DUF6249 domain-containing protein [Bacteroidales bacterium]